MRYLSSFLIFILLFSYFALSPYSVLGATDVKNDATLSTSLTSYWELEEASGNRSDSHGSNTLTDVNSVAQQTTCVQGDCADFTPNDHFTRSDDDTFDIAGDITIMMHLNLDSAGAGIQQPLVAKWKPTGNDRAWFFDYFDDTLRFYTSSNGAGGGSLTNHTVAWTPSTGTWYCVGMVYDLSAGETKFFVDGSQQGSTGTGGNTSVNNTASVFLVGRASDTSGAYVNAQIDELGFWNKEAADSEFGDVCASGSGIPYDAGGAAATPPPQDIIWFQ